MVTLPRAIRAFEVVAPVDIYRVVGRRPADVWVDASGNITAPSPASQQLTELVYWHTAVMPGEQIQERLGGLFLVTPEGACHPIALFQPQPINPKTAFLHAQTVRTDNEAVLDALLAANRFTQVRGFRVTHYPSRPSARLVAADHPLIIEERPTDLDEAPVPPTRRTNSGWS